MNSLPQSSEHFVTLPKLSSTSNSEGTTDLISVTIGSLHLLVSYEN